MWPWLALLLLGAVHGVNPGMGWLFAVALGVQDGERRAVWRAMLPLAAGHAVAIALAIAAAAAAGVVLPVARLRWVIAAALLALGVSRLVRHRHPRWGGMRVGGRDLAVWSFLMATAHGAGLMALPFVIRATAPDSARYAAHAAHGTLLGVGPGAALIATAVHSAAYLLVTATVAVVVYEKLGLRVLRRAWVNFDLLWAGALVATALLTPLL